MRAYHAYFFLLKALVVIQFALVYLKKQSKDSRFYILSDTVFKISIAIYLFVFFWIFDIPSIGWQDKILLRFSGMILLYDIDYPGLMKIIRTYIPSVPKLPVLEQ